MNAADLVRTLTAPPPADAELIALCGAFADLYRRIMEMCPGGATAIEDNDARHAATTPLYWDLDAIEKRICALPARTPDGVRNKARTMSLFAGDIVRRIDDWLDHPDWIASILRDLLPAH